MKHEPRPLPLFLQVLLEEAKGDAAFIRDVLAGVRTYQDAPRYQRPAPRAEVLRKGRVCVTDFGGRGRPVLFVPSLINPPHVLDLTEDNSLLRWLAASGLRPLLLDWGDPRDGDGDLSVGGHVEELLIPLLRELGPELAVVGYCLGGTMALAAAAHVPLVGLVTIATPWNFGGYPPDALAGFSGIWEAGKDAAEALDLFPMEMLQSAFWRLDPQRTLTKYATFGKMAPDSPEARAFVVLEDWANDGPPLALPAAREMFEHLFIGDLPGKGAWRVGDRIIDPAALDCPAFNIISTSDRIVPATTAPEIGKRLVLQQGHVGMIIGGKARTVLWEPLHHWLSQLR